MKRFIIDKLKEWQIQDRRKPLIIKGARQVGKTYILHEFGRSCFPKYHYINFERDRDVHTIFRSSLNPLDIISQLSLHLKTSICIDSDLLVFDEIQACSDALNSLKYFAEDMPNMAVCAAGSLLGLQLSSGSFPVGKVSFLDMFPMTFEEFLLAMGENQLLSYLDGVVVPDLAHRQLFHLLKQYFVVGGLPEVVQLYASMYRGSVPYFSQFEQVRNLQSTIIRSYLADMAKHSGKLNAMHIQRCWENIPQQMSIDQDSQLPKFKFKGVVPGKSRFSQIADVLDWLMNAGLIIKINIVKKSEQPLSAYAVPNTFKLAVFDVGILGALSYLDPISIYRYDFGTYKGYFAENFIAQELMARDSHALYSWRENTSELEFLKVIDGQVIPIEVKSGWRTYAKSLSWYAKRYDPPYRVIFSAKPLNFDSENQIHQYPLYFAGRFPLSDFLR